MILAQSKPCIQMKLEIKPENNSKTLPCRRASLSRFGNMLESFQSVNTLWQFSVPLCSLTKKSALPQIQVSVSEVPSLGLKAAELATSLTQKYVATVFLSGFISKASRWALNFSPLFRFKYSYKTEAAESSPSPVHI